MRSEIRKLRIQTSSQEINLIFFMNKKVVLIIMDGWGKGQETDANAIFKARTAFIDSLFKNKPHAELKTSGEDVGLPDGQMGNSEVGHLNIGAGRVVYQDLVRINVDIKENIFQKQKVLLQAVEYVKKNKKKLHLIGLVSDGGVHSHIDHIKALCDLAHKEAVSDLFVHAFTDGRDTDPKSGLGFLKDLQDHMNNSAGKIASIVGRYYAMDRDKRWDRVKKAYDLLVHGIGTESHDPFVSIEKSYENNITDEFIEPIVVRNDKGEAMATIQPGDAVICFNFRTDRCREITMALTQKDFHEQNMHHMELHYVTMTNYDETFSNINVVYDKDNLKNTLGEVIEKSGRSQIRIAETEKYPHVSFFFSGGREEPFKNEKRILIPSPKVATYDLQPEMSAKEVTEAICRELQEGTCDFVCLNFANTDMVGHTGVFQAVMKAAETVDECVKKVVETGMKNSYSFLITADHGNAEFMINEDGSPNTAHTKNPVPLFLLDNDYTKIKNGRLADLAPSILFLMGLDQPEEMTGKVLISK